MQFEREDGQKLAKIGVKNVLDLALLIPKKFEDLSIKESPNEGENVVQIECEGFLRAERRDCPVDSEVLIAFR